MMIDWRHGYSALRRLSRPLTVMSVLIGALPADAAVTRFRVPELLQSSWSGPVIDNRAFVPDSGATAALESFDGAVRLAETAMTTTPARLSLPTGSQQSPQWFPGVTLSFFTDHGDLVPATQDVIRVGSQGKGRSYWDIIVQPGRIWSEPGDGGWSRGGFPFALVHSLEGETHNGLATFFYKNGRVSNLRIQIVQQTAPFYVKEHFTAAALIKARFVPMAVTDLASRRVAYAAERTDAVRIADWNRLAEQVGPDTLIGFDSAMHADDIVLSGIDYAGTFYLKGCYSAGGPLPWCDRARFGVWSATKALANETALLRLAEKYGPAVFEARIVDYVPEAAGYPAWRNVRFQDAIDMATGVGNGSTARSPNNISDGYLDPHYGLWYEARTVSGKLAALLRDGGTYPWGPGQVARYRDQDMFMLGVAMDRLLKTREGPSANLWTMLQQEVFAPIGIHTAPTNRTLETDRREGQPLMAYGYYPTISDMVLIARLYQSGGRHGEQQILYAPRIREILAGPAPRGRPTGELFPDGETTYGDAFWITSYAPSPACRLFYPRMIGWGGNIVALLPGQLTGIRLAKSDDLPDHAEVDTRGMARIANSIVPFCP